MRLSEITLLEATYICRHLREADAREAFATRNDKDRDALAIEIVTGWGAYGFCVRNDAGTPIALIGGTERWAGTWCCWMIATDRFDEIGKELTKWVKRSMIPGLIGLGATRIEAYSIDGHDKAHRWLRFCGAAQEARLRRYGRNNEDFLVFTVEPHVP